MPAIETERLKLRRFKLSDLGDFYDYSRNPNVGPSAGWDYHRSREESLLLLKSFVNNNEVWALEHKDDRKVIGSIGIHKDRKRDNKNARMLGYVISENYWGRGYGTEATMAIVKYAFETLDLSILSVYHYPNNERSKRVIEKCGFTYEGMLRCATITYDGRSCDDMCYSITKEEYLSLIDRMGKSS
jgi:putative acetyltransferase